MTSTIARYDGLAARAADEPATFWAEAAAAVVWHRPWTRVLDDSRPPFYRWFEGGGLNICFNALDRHVAAGRGDQVALVYDSPVTGQIQRFTYRDLLDRVAHAAGALAALGVEPGDRVVIYLPMVPEAAIAMLACARLGAIHSVVFGGFAPKELATRIDDATPRVVISASCGIEGARVIPYKPLLDAALDQARHQPAACLILQRPMLAAEMRPGRDHDWAEAVAAAAPAACAPTAATDPLYILYTSGTTGVPKGVVRDHGGYAVALAWAMTNIFGVKPGETMFTASDVGWVVGHSFIVYGPLLIGATTVLYEGKPIGTPDAGAFWRVAAEHQVAVMFTAPTAFRAIRREDPEARLLAARRPAQLRALFLAGERCDPPTLAWAESVLGLPVIDNWWQTETGWPIAANGLGLGLVPVKPGSPSRAMPGWRVEVLGNGGEPMPPGEIGNLAIRLPLPPGALTTLWQADQRFLKSYLAEFPGYYQTGDAGYIDEDGYIFVMTRTDDIINVAAHRLSTGAIEEVVAAHPMVAECAVIGVADPVKGQVPLAFVVLKAGSDAPSATIDREVVALVRDRIGAIAAPKSVLVVDRLPKTRSGKILRQAMRGLADGKVVPMPATIEDPRVLDEIAAALAGRGEKG